MRLIGDPDHHSFDALALLESSIWWKSSYFSALSYRSKAGSPRAQSTSAIATVLRFALPQDVDGLAAATGAGDAQLSF
jgi:hypothetical protein